MRHSLVSLLSVAALILSLSPKSWAQSNANETDPLIANAQVLPYEWSPGQSGNISIKMQLPEGFHAYEDQFRVVILEPDGFKIAPFKIEPITEWYDKFSKKQRKGVEKTATLTAHIEAPDRFLKRHTKMKLELTYQACSSQFCLFPTTKTLDVPIMVTMFEGGAQVQEPEAKTSITPSSFLDASTIKHYLGNSLALGLLFVFLAGIFTSFTPCIFPMIPITLAVLGNHANERTRLQNFITSCVYVLGIATTYSVLGLIAAESGSVFGASLGSPLVLSIVCVIFLAMSLSMYGLYEFQVPAFIRNSLGNSKQQKNLGGAYLTGMFAGIVASPCVGPVLVAILTYVASTQNRVTGFLYLFFYALGLGLIFIVLGLSNQFSKFLPRSGVWMNSMKFILGTLMLGAFYYYLDLLLPVRWFDAALGIGLVVVASVYGAFIASIGKSPVQHVRKGVMQAVLFVGIGYIALAVFDLRPYLRNRMISGDSLNQTAQVLNWQPYSEAAVAQAVKDRKPVIIDFWADWCAACHELEEQTFTDPRIRALASNFVLLKFDATKTTPELKALKEKYSIMGLPTLIFYNSNGVWIDALTLTQFEEAKKFEERLNKARH
jgi:thiol:disulfide interchange protein DsbD